jgi:hypothetical protein
MTPEELARYVAENQAAAAQLELSPERQRLLSALATAPRQRGQIHDMPIADAIAQWGVERDTPFGEAARGSVAPMVNQGERLARAMLGTAGEMTGIPAAGRAGEALAEGNIPQAAGNALMAAPSRLAAIPGMLMSSASAAGPDPREARIRKLDADISTTQRAIEQLGRRTPDADRLEVLARPHQQMLDRLNKERTGLQDAMDAEAAEARQREEAESRGAARRNTPTAQAYPAALYAAAGAGGLLSAMLAARGARQPVAQFNERVQSLVERQRSAIARANDTSLPAAERNQARRTAQAAQEGYDTAIASAPRLTGRDRLTAALTSGAGTDIGLMALPFVDYVYSSTDPGAGDLRSYSIGQLNPIDNPGRFGAGAMMGGTLGVLGQELGARYPGVQIPPSLQAETEGLPTRYQNPRRPSAPRKRK